MSNFSPPGSVLREERLALPGDEHVAQTPLGERRRGSPRTRVEYGDVLVETRDEVASLRVVAAGLALRVAPGREVVPPRPAGGLRVGRDDGDSGLHEIVPVADSLRIARAHQKHDRGGERDGSVRQPSGPRCRKEPRASDRVDVVSQAQRDHVGFESVDDGSRLLRGAAVRLPNRHRDAGLVAVALREGGIDRLVELPRRVVRDVEDLDLLRRSRARRAAVARWNVTRLRGAAEDGDDDGQQPESRGVLHRSFVACSASFVKTELSLVYQTITPRNEGRRPLRWQISAMPSAATSRNFVHYRG